MTDRPTSRNRSIGGRPPQDWCGLVVLYSLTRPSSAACSSSTVGNIPSLGVKNSARIVLCSRSTFPVVIGEYGAASTPSPFPARAVRMRATASANGTPSVTLVP